MLAVALALAGCASRGPFRATEPVVAGAGYKAGFVEFDEQGWFWTADRSQLSAVEKLIIQESHLGERNAGGKILSRGIILVAFVHGWKHNAAPNDENVQSFQQLLAMLARHEATLPEAERHPVVGIYLGWPGLAANHEPALELSFYSRKDTGDKVGYYGGVTETLVRLRNLSSLINGTRGQNPRSYFIVAGHSFGAQVVFNSLAAIMAEHLVNERTAQEVDLVRSPRGSVNVAAQRPPSRPVLKPFGDLVVLVNPAFEAARYYNLRTLADLFEYPPEQRPMLAIFSSKTDSATKTWFPIGRFFSTLFEHYRGDALGAEQRNANHHTVPWIDEYVTHELVEAGEPLPGNTAQTKLLAATSLESSTPAYVEKVAQNWETLKSTNLPLAGCVLCPVQPARRWTPFYVVRVNKSIINEHGGIWTDDFRNFLASFVTVSIRSP
jgi:hypothetical protein